MDEEHPTQAARCANCGYGFSHQPGTALTQSCEEAVPRVRLDAEDLRRRGLVCPYAKLLFIGGGHTNVLGEELVADLPRGPTRLHLLRHRDVYSRASRCSGKFPHHSHRLCGGSLRSNQGTRDEKVLTRVVKDYEPSSRAATTQRRPPRGGHAGANQGQRRPHGRPRPYFRSAKTILSVGAGPPPRGYGSNRNGGVTRL